MLFRKKQEKMCAICAHCTIVDEDTVQCRKKGRKNWDDKCLAFRYDPCKRVPKKARALDVKPTAAYSYRE